MVFTIDIYGFKSFNTTFLFQSNSTETILNILNYVWQQDLGKNTRTFNYVDIFCALEENKSKFKKIISSFK